MSSLLCMQGRFPGGSTPIVKWARRQSQTVEEYDFQFFFLSFSACLKVGRWHACDLLGVELEPVPTSAFKSAIDICDWSTTFACVRPLPWRSDNDSQHFFWRFDPRSPAARLRFFFFFFFSLSIAQRFGLKPPPSHMKVLSFVRDVWNFEMTPKD